MVASWMPQVNQETASTKPLRLFLQQLCVVRLVGLALGFLSATFRSSALIMFLLDIKPYYTMSSLEQRSGRG